MNRHESTASDQDQDLLWQAHLFVLGELDPSRHQEFSARLQQDPHVAEAVAEAILLQEALESDPDASQPGQLQPSRFPAYTWWAPLTAIAAGLLLALWFMQREPRVEPPAPPIAGESTQPELIREGNRAPWLELDDSLRWDSEAIEGVVITFDEQLDLEDFGFPDEEDESSRPIATPLFGMEHLLESE